jgi:type II secretory pathway pseudopilin PulG
MNNINKKIQKIIITLESQAGMTLAETLLSMAILGVSTVVFIGSLSTGLIAVNLQNEATMAQALGQTQLEVIKAASYDTTGLSYIAISEPSGYTISISTDAYIYSSSTIQEITVSIFHGTSQVLTLQDYKVNRQ